MVISVKVSLRHNYILFQVNLLVILYMAMYLPIYLASMFFVNVDCVTNRSDCNVMRDIQLFWGPIYVLCMICYSFLSYMSFSGL